MSASEVNGVLFPSIFSNFFLLGAVAATCLVLILRSKTLFDAGGERRPLLAL